MKINPLSAVLAASLLTLTACGKSDDAQEQAKADNVEMPAEETVGPLPADATPVADASAAAGAEAATAASPVPAQSAKP